MSYAATAALQPVFETTMAALARETASLQADRSLPWAGYPGGDSVRVWRTQRDIIGTVMRGEVSPEDGLAQMVEQTNALMQ